jgi:hypothetical protein
MNHELLIETLLRQTFVLVAQLATAGGRRSSLAGVSEQVFGDLSSELERQGLTKSVIADMLGMALRTYHRRAADSREREGQHSTVSDAILGLIRQRQPISAHAVQQEFLRQPCELVAGILNDLVHSGLVSRAGWGERAVYRSTEQTALEPTLLEHYRLVQRQLDELSQLLDPAPHSVESRLRSSEPVSQVAVAGQRR